jgi:hypothetical protein
MTPKETQRQTNAPSPEGILVGIADVSTFGEGLDGSARALSGGERQGLRLGELGERRSN